MTIRGEAIKAAWVCAVAAALTATPQAETGSLSSPSGGLTGTGNWNEGNGVTMAWDIVQELDGTWCYEYTFSLGERTKGGLSALILETSENLTRDDLTDIVPGIDPEDPRLYSPAFPPGSSLGLPADIFGMKFDFDEEEGEDEVTSWTASFCTPREPIDGSFYAKDGNAGNPQTLNSIWNTGLTGAGTDFIPVPDTGVTPPPFIPAPGAIVLGALGAGLVGWLRRRTIVM